MKLSRLLAPTLRDVPAEAEVISHQLLMRAGYIRRVAGGIYSYLPLMFRVLNKVNTIVREEMNKAGAQELQLPILQPAELWQQSGRWQRYGQELMRLKDRHGREACLAATAEEVITDLANSEVRSYKQLPLNLYQIGNKYRDEIRPRFGLLRGREFIMKDAYSFHATQACLEAEYERMETAYTAIFKRCGLETKMVRSDSGAIGGAVSHEFMVLTGNHSDAQQSGENDVVYCNITGYAANSEKAESCVTPETTALTPPDSLASHAVGAVVETPNTSTIDSLCQHLQCEATHILKTLLYRVTLAEDATASQLKTVAVVIRGDYDAEETKLFNAITQRLGLPVEVRMATDEELASLFNTQKGFVGFPDALTTASPSLPTGVDVLLLDASIQGLHGGVVANLTPHVHQVNITVAVSPESPNWCDVRKVNAGDLCILADANGVHHPLSITRGIEVGNIFQLGTKYSEAMQATFMNENGREEPFIMGCYGIGVSRVVASAVEQYNDANGIVWPVALAPYQVVIVPANVKDATQQALAERLYHELQTRLGDEVLLDDRDERAGLKFKDADLLGIPYRVTVGKLASEGRVELKARAGEAEAIVLEADAVVDTLATLIRDALQSR